MKKGYQCPHCGNHETGKLEIIYGDRPLLTVLLAPQKILSKPDVRISCLCCGLRDNADNFRTSKTYQFIDANRKTF